MYLVSFHYCIRSNSQCDRLINDAKGVCVGRSFFITRVNRCKQTSKMYRRKKKQCLGLEMGQQKEKESG